MEKAKIDRINELAKKEVLTEEEKLEQKELRREYIEEYKNNLRAQLDNTYIVDENGEIPAVIDPNTNEPVEGEIKNKVLFFKALVENEFPRRDWKNSELTPE